MDELSLAQYVMINWTYGTGTHSMRRGNRSVIFVQFTFQRTLGFYFLQIYIPLTIIVMSSWVSFWLVKTNQVSNLQACLLIHHTYLKFYFRARRFPPGQDLEPRVPWPWSRSGSGARPSPRLPTPRPWMCSSSSVLFLYFLRWPSLPF